MKKINVSLPLVLYCLALLKPQDLHARTIVVACGDPNARVQTIAAGIARLPLHGPGTILVSGNCNEVVGISNMDRVTVAGNPSATINGGNSAGAALSVSFSRNVTFSNIVIKGAGGVTCDAGSTCYFNDVTIENSSQAGLFITDEAHVFCSDCTIQNNASDGIVESFAFLSLYGGSVYSNGRWGILVAASTLNTGPDSRGLPPSVTNNALDGIIADTNATVALSAGTISGNKGDGVSLQGHSTFRVQDTIVISSNSGHGLRIGDLSFAGFHHDATISQNASPDVVCDSLFSATRFMFAFLPGVSTNCPSELPPLP